MPHDDRAGINQPLCLSGSLRERRRPLGEEPTVSMKVVMLTSVHSPLDVRVFHKEALTLVEHGYEVVLIAPHAEPQAFASGVRIIGLPQLRSRWLRPLNWLRIVSHALRERAEVYHFHDPELLPWGLLIQWITRKPVIYDAHEWYPTKVMLRTWIPEWLRPVARASVSLLEPLLARRLTATLTADHATAEGLRQRGVRRIVTIYNYPLRNICPPPRPRRYAHNGHTPLLLYIGTLGCDRGTFVMLDTVATLVRRMEFPVDLYLVGPAKIRGLLSRIKRRIRELVIEPFVYLEGAVPHDRLHEYLGRADLGLMPYKPEVCERNIPTKLFEYMAAGLPVVATRANMTAYFLERTEAGVLVDSQDPREYAQAIVRLWQSPQTMKRMAENGRMAFETRYNWDSEAQKLLDLYRHLTSDSKQSGAPMPDCHG
jgi:glycosyltransferase involved in cell wall biosynthesis